MAASCGALRARSSDDHISAAISQEITNPAVTPMSTSRGVKADRIRRSGTTGKGSGFFREMLLKTRRTAIATGTAAAATAQNVP
ncbi:MAG: hypothetical protein KL863_14785 [Rhizobium sp.]|nr:hypothetical protein [Rhizobium sp.]